MNFINKLFSTNKGNKEIIDKSNTIDAINSIDNITADELLDTLTIKHNEFNEVALHFNTVADNLIDFHDIAIKMVDLLEDLVWYKDNRYRYIFANKTYCNRLFNKNRKDILGCNDYELLSGINKNKKSNTILENHSDISVKTNRKFKRFIEITNTKDKEELWLDIIKVPLFSEKGNFQGIIGNGRDVTQDKNSISCDLKYRLEEGSAKHLGNKIFEILPHKKLDLDSPHSGKLGDYLIKHGYIDKDQLSCVLRQQKRDKHIESSCMINLDTIDKKAYSV